jgi:hypothetical protein
MSSPKEKSKELLNKFASEKTPEGYKMFQTLDESKRCALIAVDEILNEFPSQCPGDSYEMERHLYWQEVKTEIEKK